MALELNWNDLMTFKFGVDYVLINLTIHYISGGLDLDVCCGLNHFLLA